MTARRAGPGQAELWSPRPRRRVKGKVERALDKAVEAAELAPIYGAAVEAARSGARALDDAERNNQPQVTAQLLKSYAELLRQLTLLPDPDTAGDGPLGGGGGRGRGHGLGEFGQPTLVHPA